MKGDFMKKDQLNELKTSLSDFNDIDLKNVKESFLSVLKSLSNQIEQYIGDYPTFIEPVYLGENVRIGDDVLLGPNVYVGRNCEIGDYVEISNSILFDNVKISENIKLENCIIAADCVMNFTNVSFNSLLIKGISESQNGLEKLNF
jgi:NDP-sugar pyrophosphorylase family protein